MQNTKQNYSYPPLSSVCRTWYTTTAASSSQQQPALFGSPAAHIIAGALATRDYQCRWCPLDSVPHAASPRIDSHLRGCCGPPHEREYSLKLCECHTFCFESGIFSSGFVLRANYFLLTFWSDFLDQFGRKCKHLFNLNISIQKVLIFRS